MTHAPSAPRGPVSVTLLRLAGPVALARLGIMGMGVADTVLVGQLAPDELSHQALGWAPTSVLLVAGIGLLMGVQVLAARVCGEGRPEAAGEVWRQGLWLSLIAGVIGALIAAVGVGPALMAFGVAPEMARPAGQVAVILALSLPLHLAYIASAYFLEAVQRPTPGMVVMWLANGLNIGLNLWLIPGLGAEGSAWATVGSRVFLAGALIGYILLTPELRVYGVRAWRSAGPGVGALLGVGIAAGASQAVEAGAFAAMTVIAGRIGEAEVAAYAIILNCLSVVFMIALGLASATAVLSSEAVGRGAAREASRIGWLGLGLNTAFMIGLGLLSLPLAGAIARGFTADASLALLVAGLVPLAALILAPDGAQVVAASALRARGDNWFPTFSHIAAYAAVMPALAFWLAEMQGQGVAGLLWAIFWASVLSIAVLAARMWALKPPKSSLPR